MTVSRSQPGSGQAAKRTVWYVLAELRNPSPEPFAVLSADTTQRKDGGIVSTVVSLHMDKDEAQLIVDEFNEAPCEYCGPGMIGGLPGNACENCMNTGLKYPKAKDLP